MDWFAPALVTGFVRKGLDSIFVMLMFLSEKHANALNNAPGSSFRDTAMEVLNGRGVSVSGIGSLDSAKNRVTFDLSS